MMKIPGPAQTAILEYFNSNRDAMSFAATATPQEIFAVYCEWKGLIGYAEELWQVVTELTQEDK